MKKKLFCHDFDFKRLFLDDGFQLPKNRKPDFYLRDGLKTASIFNSTNLDAKTSQLRQVHSDLQ